MNQTAKYKNGVKIFANVLEPYNFRWWCCCSPAFSFPFNFLPITTNPFIRTTTLILPSRSTLNTSVRLWAHDDRFFRSIRIKSIKTCYFGAALLFCINQRITKDTARGTLVFILSSHFSDDLPQDYFRHVFVETTSVLGYPTWTAWQCIMETKFYICVCIFVFFMNM